jgi:hypothetical protein
LKMNYHEDRVIYKPCGKTPLADPRHQSQVLGLKDGFSLTKWKGGDDDLPAKFAASSEEMGQSF